jgi:hypothetical protein
VDSTSLRIEKTDAVFRVKDVILDLLDKSFTFSNANLDLDLKSEAIRGKQLVIE